MRWRENGAVVPFPGKSESTLDVEAAAEINGTAMSATLESAEWLDLPGDAPDGYRRYRDDAMKIGFILPRDEHNQGLIGETATATLALRTTDMTALNIDANPATVTDWENGAWSRYEDSSGAEGDSGGTDRTLTVEVTPETLPPPFLLEPGITSSWYDSEHDGEGFQIGMLEGNRAALYWYTYDSEGGQDWFVAAGEVRGNRIVFPALKRVSGGVFGPGFDPEAITRETVGSASFTWSGCDQGDMSYQIGPQKGRMQLTRITRLMGIDCGQPVMAPDREEGRLSGSWYDPTHDGEGYNLEVLLDGNVVVYWYSYGPDGHRRWFFDVGSIENGRLVFNNLRSTRGGVFGPDFDPDAVQRLPWGTLELDIDCDGGTATYDSSEEGFGSGTLNLVRLTSIDGLTCPD
jgi:hypothetical protein